MTIFEAKAPWIVNLLRKDFGLTVEEAVAIVANLGHESMGFKAFQELKPTVPGSRGGFGWAQWTGARRVQFEAYCKRNNLDPYSDKANYGFLFTELKGPESRAIPAVKAAGSLYQKVSAFERSFERAGVINMKSRMEYAEIAMNAWKRNQAAMPPPEVSGVAVKPPVPVTPPVPGDGLGEPEPRKRTLWQIIKGVGGSDSLT